MKLTILNAVFLGAILTPASLAQFDVLPSPLSPSGASGAMESVSMVTQSAVIESLTRLDAVLLTDVALPDGALVDLRLERLSVERRHFAFQVNGQPRADLLDDLNLSVWKGTVDGDADSVVMLGFSDYGSRGWIQQAGQLVHFMPQPDADGDWRAGTVLVQTEAELNLRGFALEQGCESKVPPVEGLPPTRTGTGGSPSTHGTPSCSLRDCPIALEGDYQLYQVFDDLNALTSYVTTLMTFVSDRYETQASTVLTFPYTQLWTTANDPWSAQDNGGNCIDVLYELQAAWAGNTPANANIGHLLSGASLGCGVAWLDVLCSDTHNFSVSGNINGNINFPVVQQPNNWDFMVVAHELGHNFASPHTHDYCPPLDECPSQQYWGACQDEQICLTDGTIMSYCHLCPGGTGNITTFFHPSVSTVITDAAAACLPAFVQFSGEAPTLVDPQSSTPVTASLVGTPVGPVELFYRHDGGSFNAIAMTDEGGGNYSAALPAPDCGDSPEFYYAFTDVDCGPFTDPPNAPGSVYSAQVGTITQVFGDDFESDTGWAATNLGASNGDWERGVPVNDTGWEYDPPSDSDGSGSAYLTENQLGNTDVDGGAVRLESPTMDMSSGDVRISYDYYLRLSDDDGTDRLLVEASQNGGSGPWVEVARHDTDGGLSWRTHVITPADLGAAGLTQTETMRLRFTMNDDDPQSIVEAGLDAFDLSIVDCDDGGGLGTNYCVASANSTGAPAVISASGSLSLAANDLDLTAAPVPNQNGIFYYGQTQSSLPYGNGTRCVGGTVYRLPIVTATGNLMSFAVDYDSLSGAGLITVGSSWNFQAWFRDPAGGGAAFDLSDGLELSFTP